MVDTLQYLKDLANLGTGAHEPRTRPGEAMSPDAPDVPTWAPGPWPPRTGRSAGYPCPIADGDMAFPSVNIDPQSYIDGLDRACPRFILSLAALTTFGISGDE